MDGNALSGCLEVTAGELNGTTYVAHRCQFSEGVHRVTGSDNFGLMVYGYGNVGSYAFSGGAKVEPIYEPPPLR